MQLSVSVRIAEGFLSKEVPVLSLAEVADVARAARFDAVCMRASQVGVQSTSSEIREAKSLLEARELGVSMVTGDFATVYNNEQGPASLRNIAPYVALAEQLGAPRIRVALKREEDIPAAREAAEIAAQAGVMLVHQCHTLSLFETIEGIERTLNAIGHPNFGLIYEPANLELCGQPYGAETIARLAPWIRNVYLQNQVLHTDGSVTLDTWCRGPVSFDIIPIHEPGGVDFSRVIAGLRAVGYEGPMTVHQSAPEGEPPLPSVRATADYLRELLGA